ncbi:MAG: carbon-nitrogen hydrolase family protein [Oscillospiraceae bacterium]|nr:carbon-nitrogen hydrolase family protein [Oscillospiraceae bacterium]
MRLAMAQMRMGETTADNLERTLAAMRAARDGGADLILFPEVQLSPFFPQYPGRDARRWKLTLDSPEILAIRNACKELSLYASPNVYLDLDGVSYDASLMIDDRGEVLGVSKMVHIAQAEYFYEQDYYTPSDDGFKVYDTPFGKFGIVICFDRHLPDGIRSCAAQGAELVLIPTANLTSEPLELFAWEVRVQAFQNTAFVAMCNRVGPEGALVFAGESLLAGPDGSLRYAAGGEEALILLDVPLEEVAPIRAQRPWLTL